MNLDPKLIDKIYNAFDPFETLQPGDPAYVECGDVRGDSNIKQDLGKKIVRSNSPTCHLYAGHRGVGKSTELARLQKYLEDNQCFVVYFSADQEDIDSEDAQYTDILLACTRHLLQDLRNTNPDPILHWLRDRWKDLQDLSLTTVKLDGLNVETAIITFAKITANLRAVPTQRAKIRELVNPPLIEYENYTFNINRKNKETNIEKRLTQDRKSVLRFLGYLNLQRDRFREEFDISLVFIVPIFGINYFIKRAPDFFDWRSGFFRFIPQKELVINIDYENIYQKNSFQSRQELLDLKTLSKELEIDVIDKLKISKKEFVLLTICGRYQEAIESCNSTLEINPEEDSAWFYRGLALGELERYEEAVASWDKCLEINPNKDSAWFNRACYLALQNRVEPAIESLIKAISLNQEYQEVAKTDSDFDNIREDERFKSLVNSTTKS